MTAPGPVGETQADHEHWFTAIPTHLGRFGRQDVHLHHCVEDDGCDVVLAALGRSCSVNLGQPHHRKVLTDDPDGWQLRSNEGERLTPSEARPHA